MVTWSTILLKNSYLFKLKKKKKKKEEEEEEVKLTMFHHKDLVIFPYYMRLVSYN